MFWSKRLGSYHHAASLVAASGFVSGTAVEVDAALYVDLFLDSARTVADVVPCTVADVS